MIWHGSPLHNPVSLNQQRHLLDAPQHCGGVCARGQQAHQVSKLNNFDCREERRRVKTHERKETELLLMLKP